MINAVIAGTGSYLPEREVFNTDLEQTLDTTDEWIFSRTGIRSRRIASEKETTSYMAYKAAQLALDSAKLNCDEIDLILVGSCTPDQIFPSVSCTVQKYLDIKKPIPCLDISAACSGFVYGMDIAKQYIASGTYKNILVIGAERMSSAIDWTDRSIAVLFGDGAGAVVLSASERPGILASTLHAKYDAESLLVYNNKDNETIKMRGNELFKVAVNVMGDVVDELFIKAKIEPSSMNLLVPHQANIRIIQAIAKKLSLPMSKVVVTLENQGNTSAASIPLALDSAIRSNKIKRGDLLFLESFGGGMTWGATLVIY